VLHRSFFIASLIGITLLATSEAGAQQVVAGHPRIYLRSGDVSALRTRITQAPISTYYNQMRSRLDTTVVRHTNDEISGYELESLAVLHVINGGTVYRDKILNTWRRVSYSPGQISHWNLPYQVMAHSIALDFLWNELSIAQRAELGTVIVAMMDDLYNYAPYNVPGANQMSAYSNQLYYHLGALAFAGIVLSGEGINDSRAAFYLSESDSLLRTRMIPAINQEAGGDADLTRLDGFTGNGGWGEDVNHMAMTHPMFGRMVEAWRTGTNQNLFPSINGLAKFAQYATYMRRPNGFGVPKGNLTSYQTGLGDMNYGYLGCLVSARYNDPLGAYLKQMAYTTAPTTYGFHQLAGVLWCNPALPAPDFASMPRAMHFQGQGEVVMRSGFGAQDTWVYLHSGPIYNAHQHDDQGNLVVDAYGGELLIENTSDVNHETRFHNSILVAGVEQIPYGNNEVQRAVALAGTRHERGKITSVQSAPNFTYVASDFSNAYPDSVVPVPKADKVTREVVAVLPDILVIRDRVAGTGRHEVLFHTWAGAGAYQSTTKELTVMRTGGRGWLKTVFPASATGSVTSQGTTDLLTVAANATTTTTEFLHVVYLSPASAPFTPTDLAPIDNGTEIGVSLRDRHGHSWMVTFRKGTVGLGNVTEDGSRSSAPPTAPTNLRIVEGTAQ